MKSLTLILVGAVSLAAFTFSASADTTVTLSGVHNCCKSCAKGIDKAVTGAGATAEIVDTTVTITAKDEAAAQKAVDGLLAAGYFGEGATAPEIADAKTKSATVSGVHLCCGKCVKAVEKAVTSVKGATSHTAEKGAKTFTVEGDFSTAELAAALNKEGLNGTIE
ncbi:MAG: cation transporter [Verrucomicrobiae bacterium]|nr:cation transporter [Verrucomicrobiae bacterium]